MIANQILEIRGNYLEPLVTSRESCNGAKWAVEEAIKWFRDDPNNLDERLANGAQRTGLRYQYFGSKNYEQFQNQDIKLDYGYGPSHGYVIFYIGIQKTVRGWEFNDEEIESCIEYLENLKPQ